MIIDGPDLASVRALRSRLWEAGFRPVPVYGVSAQVSSPGKQPMGAGWQNAARANPPACTRVPASPAATNTGILCDGFRVIDIDIADHARASEVEAVASDLFGQSPVRFRQNSGKRALLYRASEGEPSKRFISGTHGKVEILGRGQQFVAFGTHDTGAELEWRGGSPGEVSAGDLSPITEDEVTQFLDAIRSIVGAEEIIEKPISERALGAISPRKEITSKSRESAAFFKALTDECRSVASAGQGNRNNTLNTAAFNLAQMVAAGWGSAGEVNAALMDAARECGLPAMEAARTIRSGMTGGAQNPRAALADRRDDKPIMDPSPLLRGKAEPVAAGDGDDDDDLDDDGDDFDATPLDEDLTRVGGVLGEIIEAMVRSARRPNRRLALAAALPLLGTVIGRRVSGPTQSGTHLYVISTGETGIGKQHYLSAIERFAMEAGLGRHLGPSQFMSLGAIVKFMARAPLSICPQDEFGAILKKITHPKASGHELAISAVLREAWGRSFQPFRTPEYSTTSSVEIKAPALSLFAATTADELFEGLKGRDMVNGFMNRFLVIDAGARTPEADPASNLRDEAARLAPIIAKAYRIGMSTKGNMAGLVDKNGDNDPEPFVVPWQSQAAHDAYMDLSAECERRMSDGSDGGKLFARTAEMALRIATIRACGDDIAAPTVTIDHMEWASRLALQSAELLCIATDKFMVDPLGVAEFERKIISCLRAAKGHRMTSRNIRDAMSKHQRNMGDLTRALDDMAKTGVVELLKRSGSGRSGFTVRLITR